jgi:hypothetical protein
MAVLKNFGGYLVLYAHRKDFLPGRVYFTAAIGKEGPG